MPDDLRPGTPWRLLALPPLPAAVIEQLFGGPGVELVLPAERTQGAVHALLPGVDLVLGDWSHALRVDDPGPRVCFVQQPSVGVDDIDVEACTSAGVPVANTAGANATSVAEWCLSAVLALLRRTVEADAAVRRGEWPQLELGGRELAGKRVGVIGMGDIGRRVATLFGALGCPVSYWSRREHPDAPATYRPLAELVADSEILVVVIALAAETRGLVDAALLAAAAPGMLLVNAARGAVIDEPALVDALRDGRLGGAALDVFTVEPLPADSPLRSLPGVLLSPHMAGSATEAGLRILGASRDNLLRVLGGQAPVSVVNAGEGVPVVPTRRGIPDAPG